MTPHQTSPERGRMRVPGYFAGQFIRGIRALSCPIRGRMQYAPTLTVDCMGSFCQSSDLDASSDVPDKGTNAGARLCRRVICWGRLRPAVPDCGAYAVAPLRLRFLFFDRQGRGVLHTPHQTSPTRGRMRFFGCVDGAFIGIIRALPCPFVGRMLLRPTSPVSVF